MSVAINKIKPRRLMGIALAVAILLYPLVFNKDGPSVGLLLYAPALINFSLLMYFAQSLIFPPSIAERIARRWNSELRPEAVRYCYRVTLLWVLFFLLNGGIALYTALHGDAKLWTVYNGGVSYFLIGLLFVGELIYRYWRHRPYVGAPTDVIFRKIFPPRESDHK